MTRVIILDPLQDPRWDDFVEGHPFGLAYHLSDWKRVLEGSFKHIRVYYFALLDGSGERIEAGLPVFSVTSWLTGARLVSVPFATLCDPLVSNAAQFETLARDLIRIKKERNFGFIEIRMLHSGGFARTAGLGESRFYKHHFLSLDAPPDKLKQRFHRSCVRQRIARAERCSLEVKVGEDETDLKSFSGLLIKTRKRRSLPAPPFSFFKSLWEHYFPDGRLAILSARKNGHPLAAVMLLMYKDRVSVEYAASDNSFHQLSLIHFVFWRAIGFAYERGFKTFDFGRTSPHNPILMVFKSRWGTQTLDLAHFYFPEDAAHGIAHQEKSWKYGLLRSIFSFRAPSLLRRVVGEFCYCHMG